MTVSRTGEQVNAVYGLAQMLLKVLGELRPAHYAISFDLPAPTFRHIQFAVGENDPFPGAVIAVQTFGDFLGFIPHTHAHKMRRLPEGD